MDDGKSHCDTCRESTFSIECGGCNAVIECEQCEAFSRENDWICQKCLENGPTKFNTYQNADTGKTMFARNGLKLMLKDGGDPAKSTNNGMDPDLSQWDVVCKCGGHLSSYETGPNPSWKCRSCGTIQ